MGTLLSGRRWFWGVMLAALGVRLVAAVAVQSHVSRTPGRLCVIAGDAEGYWELARKLTRGDEYALYDPPRRVLRMPGFPLLLAAGMRLWGENLWLTRCGLAVLGTAGCGLVYALGKAWGDEATGLIAAGITALSPVMIGFSVLLLSETLFAVTMLASLLAFTWFVQLTERQTVANEGQTVSRLRVAACVAGVLAGVACLVRPTWLLIGPGVAGLWMVRERTTGQRSWQHLLTTGGALLAGLALTLAPWTLRNYLVTGHVIPTTLWVGASLYDGLHPGATGESDMRFIEDDGIYAKLSEYEADQYYRRKAWEFVRAHPGRTLELMVIKLWRYASPFPNAEQFRDWRLRVGVGSVFVPMVLLGMVGAWSARRQWWCLVLCGGPLVYFAAVHAVFIGSLRYRLPAEYAWGVLTAIGVQTVWSMWQRRRISA